MMVMITLRLSSNVDISILCQQSSGLPGSILAKYLRPPSLLSSDQPIRGQHQVMSHCINQSEHSMISVWRLMSSCQHARNPWSCENYGNIKIRLILFSVGCLKNFVLKNLQLISNSCFTGKCKEIGNYFLVFRNFTNTSQRAAGPDSARVSHCRGHYHQSQHPISCLHCKILPRVSLSLIQFTILL